MRSDSARRAPARALSFDQTVPRALAHRRAVAEVLLTDSAQVAPHEFVVATQIPRGHMLWADRRVPWHDPLATLEAARQGTFVVVHRYYGVPQHGMPFVSREIELRVDDLDAYRDDGSTPLEGVFHVRLHDMERRDGALSAMRFRSELAIGGVPAMTVAGGLVFLNRADYDVLRAHGRAQKRLDGAAPAAPVLRAAAELVGRFDERNVVVGEPLPGDAGELRLPLVADEAHPSFYDHPQDHVPGPLLVEAFRQAAIALAQREGALASPHAAVTRVEVRFEDFVEPDAPSECRASLVAGSSGGEVAVDVGLEQLGRLVAQARIGLVATAERGPTG